MLCLALLLGTILLALSLSLSQDGLLSITMLGLCQQVCRTQWITWRASWRCVKSLRVLTLRSASSSSWLMSVCRLRICTTICMISHHIPLCTVALNSYSDSCTGIMKA